MPFRIVRDQANKTMDVFLIRIRKYSQTLPDSILPPPEVANAPAPRMGTPQNDSSWAGWAISSFTNKIGGANGEIQTKDNPADSKAQARPSSVPPSAQNALPSQLRPVPVPLQSAPTVPRISSNLAVASSAPDVEDEDFGDGWGELEDDAVDAWGATEEPTKAPETSRASPAKFDDQGEPDFAGWLNAQTQAKSQLKKPLPKGLTKTKSGSAISPAAKALPQSKPKTTTTAAAKPSKSLQPAATQDDDDDWGEAWG